MHYCWHSLLDRDNRMWQTSCNQCRQRKMACHWDLVGITGPRRVKWGWQLSVEYDGSAFDGPSIGDMSVQTI
jgi:hypothetical protein